MQHHKPIPYDVEAQAGREGMRAVILLAALLAGVFFLALGGYGYYTAVDGGALQGELPDAVMALRDLVENNETVAVWFGLADDEAIETMGTAGETDRIREAAEQYIREKQG